MLPKLLRLPAKLIPDIARRGRKLNGQGFYIKMRFTSVAKPQFAISISKKVDKKAVTRNKIKRKFRVAIQDLAKRIEIKPAEYLIVVLDRNLAEIDQESLEIELARLLII